MDFIVVSLVKVMRSAFAAARGLVPRVLGSLGIVVAARPLEGVGLGALRMPRVARALLVHVVRVGPLVLWHGVTPSMQCLLFATSVPRATPRIRAQRGFAPVRFSARGETTCPAFRVPRWRSRARAPPERRAWRGASGILR